MVGTAWAVAECAGCTVSRARVRRHNFESYDPYENHIAVLTPNGSNLATGDHSFALASSVA